MSPDSGAPVHVGSARRRARGRTRPRAALRCRVCARARAPARRSAWSTHALPDLRNVLGTTVMHPGEGSSWASEWARVCAARGLRHGPPHPSTTHGAWLEAHSRVGACTRGGLHCVCKSACRPTGHARLEDTAAGHACIPSPQGRTPRTVKFRPPRECQQSRHRHQVGRSGAPPMSVAHNAAPTKARHSVIMPRGEPGSAAPRDLEPRLARACGCPQGAHHSAGTRSSRTCRRRAAGSSRGSKPQRTQQPFHGPAAPCTRCVLGARAARAPAPTAPPRLRALPRQSRLLAMPVPGLGACQRTQHARAEQAQRASQPSARLRPRQGPRSPTCRPAPAPSAGRAPLRNM